MSLTRFVDGAKRDVIDVLYTGEIEDYSWRCEYDVGDDGAGTLKMEISVFILAKRGPADRERLARYDYFVSVIDAAGAVLNKENFSVAVAFPANRTRRLMRDSPVILNIPLTAGQTGRDFRIFVGFQLSRGEIEFNRKQRSGAR